MQFVWTITGLEVAQEPQPNTVVISGFKVSCGEHSVDYRVQLLPPEGGVFVGLESITEEMALAWTKAALGEERVANMEAEVQAKVEASQAPTTMSVELPWAPSPVTEEDAAEPDQKQGLLQGLASRLGLKGG